jgi:MoaA/NifB/PqqE/SkfB family radical SAM enzyme
MSGKVLGSLKVRGFRGTVKRCGEIIRQRIFVKVSVDPAVRPLVHLINEMPNLDELDRMVAFCHDHNRITVSGNGKNREWFLKFMEICGISVAKYKVTDEDTLEICGEKSTGEGVGKFLVSAYNTRTIVSQMMPRPDELMAFEISLADHCNLDCQMCDHYSQLSEKYFVDINRFEKDMVRMGQICNHKIRVVTLLGGEPTLHRDIIKCMEITRREFPDPAELIILTNGLLLSRLEKSPRGNIWEACKKYNFHISVTMYPINFDYEVLEKKATEYEITLMMSSDIHAKKPIETVKMSVKHTLDLSGRVEKHCFIDCSYFNKHNVLKNGRFYMCPVSAHSGIFNKYFGKNLELMEADSVDIYKINSLKELEDFTSYPVPFCRYCDIKKWNTLKEWDHSTKEISEYV